MENNLNFKTLLCKLDDYNEETLCKEVGYQGINEVIMHLSIIKDNLEKLRENLNKSGVDENTKYYNEQKQFVIEKFKDVYFLRYCGEKCIEYVHIYNAHENNYDVFENYHTYTVNADYDCFQVEGDTTKSYNDKTDLLVLKTHGFFSNVQEWYKHYCADKYKQITKEEYERGILTTVKQKFLKDGEQ